MEGNPIQALVVFLGFILVNAIMYSYGEALKNINENELEKRVDDGSKRAKKILKMIGKPDKLINTIQVISTATTSKSLQTAPIPPSSAATWRRTTTGPNTTSDHGMAPLPIAATGFSGRRILYKALFCDNNRQIWSYTV